MSKAWLHRFLGISSATVLALATFWVALPASAAAQSSSGGPTIWLGPSQCGVAASTTAPANAAYMKVQMFGASGGSGGAANSAQGYGGHEGIGGGVEAEFPIQGGQTFTAVVGCAGQSAPQGNGVVGIGGNGGAGWSAGGQGGNGYYCSGICGNDYPLEGYDGSGGGGGGSTGLCVGTSCSSYFQENLSVPSSLLAVAGGGGGGGETMCAGTYGGIGGTGGVGATTSDVSGIGSGPTGGDGGSGGFNGSAGGTGIPNDIGSAVVGADGNGGGPNSTNQMNSGDVAGGGGGGGGLASNNPSSADGTDCSAAGGGAGGSSWVRGTAISSAFGHQIGTGNGSITITFLLVAPPTATISSPVNGGTYQLNQTVDTTFSCAEAPGGPGLVSCTDSNGSTTGHGQLDTSGAGVHTYTVTALSKDGQTGTATITYHVAPAAIITSPASGGTYVVGQAVPTAFQCVTGSGGIGLASCTDSNGVSGTNFVNACVAGGCGVFNISGTGHLDTASSGTYTYTVTATGTDGDVGTATISYTVNRAATATSVSSSANPSVVGQRVTYTATVVPVAPGAGSPAGTVTFTDGSTTVCGAVPLNGSGQATCQVTYTSVGSHSITAAYSGDTNFKAGTSPTLTQQVNQAATATSVSSSVNPSVVGQQVTYTATVAPVAPGAGSPAGTVTFTDGSTTVCGAVPLTVSDQATCQVSYTSVGSHSITAAYSGDTNFKAGTSPTLTQQVNRAATTTSVSSSANPSLLGQNVTFTATVAVMSPGSGTPTGTVTFADGSTTIGTGTLSQVGGVDQATFSTSQLSVGPQTITASFGGDSNFKGSSGSLSQQVSYRFTLQGPVTHGTTLHGQQSVLISFTLTDAQGNVVTDATASLDMNGQPATTGVGFSGGTNAFTFKGGQYTYLLRVTAADVVNGQVNLSIHVSDGTSHTLMLTVPGR